MNDFEIDIDIPSGVRDCVESCGYLDARERLNISRQEPFNLLFLATGWSVVRAILPDGRDVDVDLFAPGDTVFHHCFSGSPKQFVLMPLIAVTFLRIPWASLWRRALDEPAMESWALAITSRQHLRDQARLADLAVRPASERVARLVVETCVRENGGPPTAGALRIGLPLGQRTIAGLLGLTSAHVSRVIRDFERRDLLRYRRTGIDILNFEGLARHGHVSEDELRFLTMSLADHERRLAERM